MSDAEATKDALGADVALPINSETVYALRQQVATLTVERDQALRRNMLNPQATEYVDALTAEVERLRGALEEFTTTICDYSNDPSLVAEAASLLAALTPTQPKEAR